MSDSSGDLVKNTIKLTTHNWSTWSVMIQTLLRAKECWSVCVELPPVPPSSKGSSGRGNDSKSGDTDEMPSSTLTAREYDKADAIALSIFHQTVSPNLRVYVLRKTAREAWASLISKFNKKTEAAQNILMTKLISLRIGSDQDPEEFATVFSDVLSQYRDAGGEMSDKTANSYFLSAIEHRYPTLIENMQINNTVSIPDVDQLADILSNIELRRSRAEQTSEPTVPTDTTALYTHGRRTPNRTVHGSEGGRPATDRIRTLKQSTQCFYCKKTGHWKRECPQRPTENQSGSSNNSQVDGQYVHTANHEVSDTADYFNMYTGQRGMAGKYVLDSGATAHMTGDKTALTEFKQFEKPVVIRWCSDTSKLYGTGTGTLKFHTLLGGKRQGISLSNVLYVESMNNTLISLSQLSKKGFTAEISDSICNVRDKDNTTRLLGQLLNGLYCVETINYDGVTEYAQQAIPSPLTDETTIKLSTEQLWHYRFAHAGMGGLQQLSQNNLVIGMKPVTAESMLFCEACELGKHTRMSLTQPSSRHAHRSLERIHSDLCEENQIKSLGGTRYVLMLIDEYTNYRWSYYLHNKSEVADIFRRWRAQVENEFGHAIIYFRSDNGGEYMSRALQQQFDESGIIHEKSAPYTPEQNGKAERTNRTVFNLVRAMIQHGKLDGRLWAHAHETAVYTLNRTTGRVTVDSTPYERLYGHKPDVSNLRVFGCIAYAHRHDDNRSKVEANAIKCQFIGYTRSNRTYKLLNLQSGKVFTAGHVTFCEYKFPSMTIEQQSRTAGTDTLSMNPVGDMNPATQTPLSTARTDDDTEQDETNIDDRSDNVGSSTVEAMAPGDKHRYPKRSTEKLSKPADTREWPIERILSRWDYGKGNKWYKVKWLEYEKPTWQPLKNFTDEHDGTISQAILDYEAEHADSSNDEADINEDEQTDNVNQPEEEAYFCFNIFQCFTSVGEPQTVAEAMSRPEAPEWKKAMETEISALKEHGTFEAVNRDMLPENANILDSKWVYKTKVDENGNIDRYKGRLVVRGFQQREGIDYNETYAPVVRYSNIRLVLTIAAVKDLEVHQLDVDTAFLYGELREDVYMHPPDGYMEDGVNNDNTVLKLRKSLYGLKQAPAVWYDQVNEFLVAHLQFNRVANEYGLYTHIDTNIYCIISVYVDDIMIACNDKQFLDGVKQNIFSKWRCKDIGEVKSMLGIEIKRDRDQRKIYISQRRYCNDVLERFQMDKCNSSETPCSELRLTSDMCPTTDERKEMADTQRKYPEAVGCLMYLTLTRPDITYAVNQVSRYTKNPGMQHWNAVKRIMRYLKGTTDYTMTLGGDDSMRLHTYTDADWAQDRDDRRSTSGYVCYLGVTLVSWGVRRQKTVAMSSAEAEYMAASDAVKEILYLRQILSQLGVEQIEPTTLLMDNQGAEDMTHNPAYHDRSKHIDIRYHFIRERVDDGTIQPKHVSSKDMKADIMTKPLSRQLHKQFTALLRLSTISHSGGVENGARQLMDRATVDDCVVTTLPLRRQ
jgi:transposase InsO family protein